MPAEHNVETLTVSSKLNLGKALMDAMVTTGSTPSIGATLSTKASGIDKVCSAVADNLRRTTIEHVFVPVDEVTAQHLAMAETERCKTRVELKRMEYDHEKWRKSFDKEADKEDGAPFSKKLLTVVGLALAGVFVARQLSAFVKDRAPATVDAAVG